MHRFFEINYFRGMYEVLIGADVLIVFILHELIVERSSSYLH